MTERVFTLDSLMTRAKEWRDSGCSLVFTNGCFDILHVGHLQTLSSARKEGDKLIVGLNSDASVKRLKGPARPINCQQDRAAMLAGLRAVDAVIIFDQDTPNATIEALKPDVHVKGGDYKVDELPEADIIKKYGGRIVIIDLVPQRSTTSTIEKAKTL